MEPCLNRQGAKWGGALEYFQVPKNGKSLIAAKPDEDDDESHDEFSN
jgi:hypothetical protein